MRRSLAALMGTVILATLGGCGGGGGSAPQSSKSEPEGTASIAGPGESLTPAVNPELPVLPGEILPPIEDDSKRMANARKQIDTLNQAVLTYIEKNKEAPPSLSALLAVIDLEGKTIQPGYINPILLVDPWGASVMFDPSGSRNKNHGQPDVWSLGPPSGGLLIGNWSDQPTPVPAPSEN